MHPFDIIISAAASLHGIYCLNILIGLFQWANRINDQPSYLRNLYVPQFRAACDQFVRRHVCVLVLSTIWFIWLMLVTP